MYTVFTERVALSFLYTVFCVLLLKTHDIFVLDLNWNNFQKLKLSFIHFLYYSLQALKFSIEQLSKFLNVCTKCP